MNFICQAEAIKELDKLANSYSHSVLIEGPEGCGKTYLAGLYAQKLSIEDFLVVDPSVQSIREAVDSCYQIDTPVVICIENLDKGVVAASYTLLKFLEEPKDNVFVVVTCRNRSKVPDTIISRSVCVTTSPPINKDIDTFAQSTNSEKYVSVSSLNIWKCVRTFKDAETILNMTLDQLNYFETLKEIINFKDSVSNMVWRIGHYSDNTETPVELVIRYLMEISNSSYIRLRGVECLRDISSSRVAAHAVLAKFVFECKYCE